MKRIGLLITVGLLVCGTVLAAEPQTKSARAADKKFDWWQTPAPAARSRAASKKTAAPARAAEVASPREDSKRLAIEPLRWPRTENAPGDARWVIELPR